MAGPLLRAEEQHKKFLKHTVVLIKCWRCGKIEESATNEVAREPKPAVHWSLVGTGVLPGVLPSVL